MLSSNHIRSPFGPMEYWFKDTIKYYKYYLQHVLPNKQLLNDTRLLKNSKKGKSTFVFANGPSLNILDIYKVAYYIKNYGFDLFAVNSFISNYSLSPTHYVLSDPVYFNRLHHDHHRRIQLNDDLKNIISSSSEVFIPVQYHNYYKPNHYCFCDFYYHFSNNVFDILRPHGYLSMTAYKALAIAGFMGYDRIYICGFDNDYFKNISVSRNNEILFEDKHFFGDNKKVNKRPLTTSIGDFLYRDHFLFSHLEKFKGKEIINLNPHGLIDTFSKSHDLDIYTK